MELQHLAILVFASGLISGILLNEVIARFRMCKRIRQFYDVNYNPPEHKQKNKVIKKLNALFNDCLRFNKVNEAKKVLNLRDSINQNSRI